MHTYYIDEKKRRLGSYTHGQVNTHTHTHIYIFYIDLTFS
jgi:hypothetical protein